jgi:hypothetical protein
MKRLFLTAAIIIAGTFVASAQTVCPHPSGCVTISRDAALKALADADENKALKAEVKVKDQAIDDLTELLNKMRVEFAECSGEKTALKQNAVSDRAIIDILLKNVRPKKIGLINIF